MNRARLPTDVEAQVLVESRRRCCLCYGLRRDSEIKRGQIAHLDRNPRNNKPDNLAFLCFDHHDEYDTRTSQSKGLTATEVKVFRAELREALAAALRAPLALTSPAADDLSWPGLYRWEHASASAELELTRTVNGEFHASGLALWGTRSPGGPHTGEIDAAARLVAGKLLLQQGDYMLELTRIAGGIEAKEVGSNVGEFGMNVTFEGTYGRVPVGAQALPQPQLRPFESEFWPEEGRPVFEAREDVLPLRARPTMDAPVIATITGAGGKKLAFRDFRYRTVRPGTVLATKDSTVVGRNLGQTDYVSHANYYGGGGERVSFTLREGTELEYLQYRAEGEGFIRWQGLVIVVETLPWLEAPENLRLITSPVAESWVMVESNAGQGWILGDEYLYEVGREF